MEVTLKDICEMQSGGTPKRSNTLFYGGQIPWVTISDFKNAVGDVIQSTEETLTEDGLKAINNRYFKQGTLLLAMYGSIGKTAILGIDASTNQAILGIYPKDPRIVNIKYVKYWLDYNKNYISYQGKGAALRNISLSIVQRQKLNLPDIETQNKIVIVLDKAEAILNKRDKTIQKYSNLLQAIFLDMFGDPVINPKGWNKITLGELGVWKSGGTPIRSNLEYFKGDIPWVTSGELNELYLSKTNECITQEALANSNAKVIPAESILLGMYDTAALKSSINTIPLTCNQAVAYSTIPTHKLNLLYLHTVLQIGRDFYKSTQRGGRQQNLNLTMIRNISIPNPPIELQRKFESFYLKYIEIINRLNKSSRFLNDLYNSLSQLAFKGELKFEKSIDLEVLLEKDYKYFKENSNNESISQLLKRIAKDELNKERFYESEIYDKAKDFVFELLKDRVIEQYFDEKSRCVKLRIR